MTNNYSRNWAMSLKENGYSRFEFKKLPKDMRVNELHRKAISNGHVRRVGYSEDQCGRNRVSVWQVTI